MGNTLARPWNLNRLLIMIGGALTLVGMLASAAWDPSRMVSQMTAPLLLGPIAAIVLAFYAPAWMYLVAGFLLAAFPLVVLFVFGAVAGIIHPGSGAEGIGLLLLLAAALLGLHAGLAGFIDERGNMQPPVSRWTSGPGVVAVAILAFVAGLALSSAWADRDYKTLATLPGDHVESPDATATIFASGIAFAPPSSSIPSGQLVALTLDNRDAVTHTWTYVRDGETHTTIMPAKTSTTVYLKFSGPDEIAFHCEPHPDMKGTLTVA